MRSNYNSHYLNKYSPAQFLRKFFIISAFNFKLMKEIIAKAKEWALEEIRKNGTPAAGHFEISNLKGQELAKKLNADKEIVMLGTILMDIKLGECLKEGKLPEHITRGVEAARKFLASYNLDKKTTEKIINSITAHHGTVKYTCKEAEICANADCYRFLNSKGFFIYCNLLGKRTDDLIEYLKQLEYKVEEKWKVLSLDLCKEELEPHYKIIKEIIKKARE